MAVPTAQQMTITAIGILGAPNTNNIQVGSFTAPSDWVASYGLKTTVRLPANTSDIAVNLATLFPGLSTCTGIFIKEVTLAGTGFQWSSNATGTRTAIKANGFVFESPADISPPTLYFNNVHLTEACDIEIGVFGS